MTAQTPDVRREKALRALDAADAAVSLALDALRSWVDHDRGDARVIDSVRTAADALGHATTQVHGPDEPPESLHPGVTLPMGWDAEAALAEVRARTAGRRIQSLGRYRAALRSETAAATSLLREATVSALNRRLLTWERACALAEVSPDTLGRWVRETAGSGP
jgi:hypothetical protein